MRITNINGKKAMNLKGVKKGYMAEFGGRKEKDEGRCNYIIISKIKRILKQ